jgi:hypothetical protein
VYVTVALPLPAVAVPIVGVCGTVVAVILFDALDALDVPAAEVAVTVNVYATSDCSPVTVIGELEPVPVNPPGELVTVYEVIGNLLVGAVKVTVAAPLLYARPVPTLVAVPIVGAAATPLAPDALAPRIGIFLFYPNLAQRDLATMQQLQA